MGMKLKVTLKVLLILAVVATFVWSFGAWIAISILAGNGETKKACMAMTGISALIMCPLGTQEFRRSVGAWGIQKERICCDPNHKKYLPSSIVIASLCKSTTCLIPSNSTNYCSSLDVYYSNNGKTRLRFVEVLRESCTINGEEGVISECCFSGSPLDNQAATMIAEPNEFPHMARLIINKNNTPVGCGGTIYSSRWIITAAHCAANKPDGEPVKPEDVKVIIGTNLPYSGNGEIYIAKKIVIHPSYLVLFNDIALLELVNDIEFNAKIRALEIAPEDFNPLDYAEEAVRMGWGTTALFPANAPFLHKSNLLIRTLEACLGPKAAKHYNMGKFVLAEEKKQQVRKLLCLGGIYDKKLSPIAGHGDSGGPAICRGPNGTALLCGVASRSPSFELCKEMISAGEECYPSYYTNIPKFNEWIQEIAGEQDPGTFHQPQLYGKNVSTGDYPHQVYINSKNGKSCGGTLIASDIVVTAAHCVIQAHKESFEDIQVLVDADWTLIFGISRRLILPGFQMAGLPVNITKQGQYTTVTDNYFKNDLALLKLDREVDISPSQFPAISKMLMFERRPRQGMELAFVRGKGYSLEMRSRYFRFLEMEKCQSVFHRAFRGINSLLDNNLICGVEKYSGGSTCYRKLGGGVICEGVDGREILCGIQVFRYCESSIPNLFLNVGMYADWILDSMAELAKPVL